MNLKSVIVILNFLLTSITVFGQYNCIQKLGSIATVTMPDTPEVNNMTEGKAYVTNYDGLTYFANLLYIGDEFTGLFNSPNKDSIANRYMDGFLRRQQGKLLYRDKLTMNGHQAIQFGYKGVLKDQKKFGYFRLVVLNDTLVTCGLVSSLRIQKNDTLLTTFFNNFKVLSAEELKRVRPQKAEYKPAQGLAVLMAIIVCLGVIFKIILVITASRKNKN